MIAVKQVSSPNKCARSAWDGKSWIPDIMVYHIADGYATAVNWMCVAASGTSSHFFIAADGAVTQLVPLNYAAYTQGLYTNSTPRPSQAKSSIVKARNINPNAYAISIEYEGFYNKIRGAINDAQIKATIDLMPYIQSEIKRLYGAGHELVYDREHNLGHCDINPINRSCCPGELFPYDKIINGYKGITDSSTTTKPSDSANTTEDSIVLKNQKLYASAYAKTASKTVSGTYYIYDNTKINGRIRVTSNANYVGKTPTGNYVTGYIDAAEKKVELSAGSEIILKNIPLYASSTTTVKAKTLTGTYYLYDGKLFSNRYRICSNKAAVGGSIYGVIGYINKSDIE